MGVIEASYASAKIGVLSHSMPGINVMSKLTSPTKLNARSYRSGEVDGYFGGHSYLKPLETGTCRWFFSSSLSVPDYHSGLLSVTSNWLRLGAFLSPLAPSPSDSLVRRRSPDPAHPVPGARPDRRCPPAAPPARHSPATSLAVLLSPHAAGRKLASFVRLDFAFIRSKSRYAQD